ncbi:hypothetical protein CEQ90_10025 [Lewinellaceae bacterium SD302]|nr:hypothetical protein CEQ90_10025 [Lewinellaceae bacterium SD302]
MSKRKATRKEKQSASANKYAAQPAAAPAKAKVKTRAKKAAAVSAPARELTYGPEFYKWVGGGFLLVIIGMLLMTGGEMPDPNVWDESIIYSFRRITLAPIIILGGLGVVTYAIFKK